MLSLAILAHGYLARPMAATAPAPQPGIEARIQAAAEHEVERRLQAELRPVLAAMERQSAEREKLDVARSEQRMDDKREADLKAVRYALETYERRLNFALLSASRRSGGD